MAHLVLVSEAKADARITEPDPEQGSEEHRPLLGAEREPSCGRSAELKELSTSYSLIPDASLPAQVRRPSAAVDHQLRICMQRSKLLECSRDFKSVFSTLLKSFIK